MRSNRVVIACVSAILTILPISAVAQEPAAPTPAPPAEQLPPVEVIQKKAAPAPTAQKKAAPKKKTAVAPTPQPPPPVDIPEQAAFVDTGATPYYYGAPGGQAAAARAESGPSSPINPAAGILPGNLEGFPSAGSQVATQQIDEFEPRTTNDVFKRVPGVHVVNDDGFARHGGIGIRGSPPRRSRKVLVMEDGQPINMGLWFDPSTHYIPPMDRIESVEVLRGTVIAYGPNNNHGVVNFRNISPFGRNETEISTSIGTTNNDDGFLIDGADVFTSIDERSDVSSTWHVHTRQMSGNVGAVLSYSGADVDGAWDTERLRYNDLHGALGWKGVDQDLTLSATYFRQRDHYDESNLEGEEGVDDPGDVEARFFNEVQHCKSCYNPGSRHNNYNADVVKMQAAHNLYLDDTTTITSRLYGFFHRRDRYANVEGTDPLEEDDGFSPVIIGDEVFVPEGSMLGRLRTYRQFGAEVRAELAERPFIAGLRQDIQVGVRYEYTDFSNRNFFGEQGVVLEEGDTEGVTVFDRDTNANAFSAFLQSAIHVTRDFTVTPGARLEHYRVQRKTFALTEEEGELEEVSAADCAADTGGLITEECFEIENFSDARYTESFTKTHVLPGVALAYTGLYRSTLYGGYHRGLTIGVLREATLPPGDELGDNFQIGLRSTALLGFTFDIAAFHQQIQDFQVKGSATDAAGNNIYSNIDQVEINGVETYGRLDSKPFTGGPFNLFFEGNYTFSDSVIDAGVNEDGDSLVGNLVPEVPRHFATLTLGVEHRSGWDASVSYTYRGAFYTDAENTPYGGDEEGEDGEVPSVWLLSARANYTLPGTTTKVFVAGDNLTDELYITDREDGIKAGQGRTVWGGVKVRLD